MIDISTTVEVRKRRDKDDPCHSGVFWSDCSDASYILLHPQHPHRSMKDWTMSYRQKEQMTKRKGVTNNCFTEERERLFLLNFTSNTGTNVVDFCV